MNIILYISVSLFVQLLAAISGNFYLKKGKQPKKWNKYFVKFLWLTFFVEFLGLYAAVGYYSDYNYLSCIKDTPFADNSWLFNLFLIFNFAFLAAYFSSFIENEIIQKVIAWLIILYVLISSGYLIYTDVFFKYFSRVSVFLGSVLLIISILLFYYQILKSEKLLKLKGYLPFYLSIGCGIFYLCTTPLFLYTNYLSIEDVVFLQFYQYVLFIANIFMYLFYALSFVVCSRKAK